MGFFTSKLADAIGGAVVRHMSIDPAITASGYSFFSVDGKEEINFKECHATAYYSNAYRACALAKARPLASLPVNVFERDKGVRKISNRHAAKDLARLLRTEWNPFVSATEGLRWLDMTKDAMGEAFVRVEWTDAKITALWPMSGIPTIEIGAGGKPIFNYGGDKFTKPGRYLAYEIVWVKSPVTDPDGLHGVSLAELAASELNMSIDLEDFYSHLLGGQGNFPGWLETPAKMNPQDMDKLKEQLQDGGGVVNAGKVRIFDNGLTYHTTGQSMVDMSLVEQEKWILQQLCRTLSVPPQEVYDLSHATYSNVEQGSLNFANKTLVPECVEIERAFSRILWNIGLYDCYVQFDMNGLLRGSYKDRMDGYRIGIYSGIYCPNETRAKEDIAPYEGGQYFMRSTAYDAVDPETGEVIPASTRAGLLRGGSGEGTDDYAGDGNGGSGLDAIHADMEARIKQRVIESGDCEKTRDFATKVLKPYATACLMERIEYDIESDVERIIENAGH